VPGSDRFQSPWGLIGASLGFSIGIGNFLFFPRLALQYGGGTFLIPWMICMATWSLPLLIAECWLGKGSRRGVVQTVIQVMGEKYAWIGMFMGVTCLAILFYHSVVIGWLMKYMIFSFTDTFDNIDLELSQTIWESYSQSFTPMISHLVVISIGASIVYLGVNHGIQRINLVLVPMLFLLAFGGLVFSVSLPGTEIGISRFFFLGGDGLADIHIWMDALAYSAVSFAVGMGIYLTYSTYSKFQKQTTLEGVIIAFGTHAFALVTAVGVISLVYGVLTPAEVDRVFNSGVKDMDFGLIWMPKLFSGMPAGEYFVIWFFVCLFLVSMTTLIGLLELPIRVCMDFGLQRHQSVLLVWLVTALFGMPGAIYNPLLTNQNFVWGNGLILAGIFMSLVFRRCILTLSKEMGSTESGKTSAPDFWVKFIFRFFIPLQGILLLTGFVNQGVKNHPDNWWNPFAVATPATWMVQCGLVLVALYFLNGRIRFLLKKPKP